MASPYKILSDDESFIAVNTSENTQLIVLPDALALQGKVYFIFDKTRNAAKSTITISTLVETNTIHGEAQFININKNNGILALIACNEAWNIFINNSGSESVTIQDIQTTNIFASTVNANLISGELRGDISEIVNIPSYDFSTATVLSMTANNVNVSEIKVSTIKTATIFTDIVTTKDLYIGKTLLNQSNNVIYFNNRPITGTRSVVSQFIATTPSPPYTPLSNGQLAFWLYPNEDNTKKTLDTNTYNLDSFLDGVFPVIHLDVVSNHYFYSFTNNNNLFVPNVVLNRNNSIFILARSGSNARGIDLQHGGNISTNSGFIFSLTSNASTLYLQRDKETDINDGPDPTTRTIFMPPGAVNMLNESWNLFSLINPDYPEDTSYFMSFYSNGYQKFIGKGSGKNESLAFTRDLYINKSSNNFDLGEVLIFSEPLNTLERQRVEGYVMWKWGLQNNLPFNHSFRSVIPTLV